MRKVLVLGAGLVCRPLVRYLLDRGYHLTVADLIVSKAAAVVDGHPNGVAELLDASDAGAMRGLVAGCDVAVSLLPAQMHPEVARACLDLGKHMVTASYVSPEMRALHDEAVDKDLLLLNELGVDPGTDHMSAMQVIHTEQRAGGTLVGFTSWCGGLPAPEANDNPFGYKFSWAPRAVLVAARSDARWLQDGDVVELPGSTLFSQPRKVEVPGVGEFEGYPNRDSVAYIDTYGFDANVKTMFRGTLRNVGHCELYAQLIALGLLDQEPEHDFAGKTHRGLLEELFGAPLEETIPAKLGVAAHDAPLEHLDYIGLLDDTPIEAESGGLLEVLADRMMNALVFAPGERDMIVMRHDIDFDYDGGARKERITAIMNDYGIPNGDSSMARTVSLPAAIGVHMLLAGKIPQRGVVIPLEPDIYEPILGELAELGIRFAETRSIR